MITTNQLIEAGIISQLEYAEFLKWYDPNTSSFIAEPTNEIYMGFYSKVKKKLGRYKQWAVIEFVGSEGLDADDKILYPLMLAKCELRITSSLTHVPIGSGINEKR